MVKCYRCLCEIQEDDYHFVLTQEDGTYIVLCYECGIIMQNETLQNSDVDLDALWHKNMK